MWTISPEQKVDVEELIKECQSWDEKIDKVLEKTKDHKLYSQKYLRNIIKALYNRLKVVLQYDLDTIVQIKSPITLIRPTEVSIVDIEEDYSINKYTTGPVSLKFIEGNHMTMLDNPKLIQIINELNPCS